MNRDELIKAIHEVTSSMVRGKRVTTLIPTDEVAQEDIPVVETFNKFIGDIVECQDFIDRLVNGELNTTTPSRSNFAAGALKELHSQLISTSVNMRDLCDGKMVSKLYYPGELFDNYNDLISLVSDLMKGRDKLMGQRVSSWSYHQVLAAMNQLNTMVLQYNSEGKLMFANMMAKKNLKNTAILPEVGDDPEPDDLMSYLGKFTNILKRIKPHETLGNRFPVDIEINDKKTDKWYSVTTDVANLSDGKPGVIHMIDDIDDWKDIEQELREEASLDPLTSAYTRKVGDKKFQEIIDSRKASDNCVGMVDLDGLKQINDNYGHIEGDFAIKTVAAVMMSSVRNADWVIRYGGDEFLILFTDCTEGTAKKIVSRMYERLDNVNKSIEKPYKIRFSVGLIQIDETMNDIKAIIDMVDDKMYKNKTSSKKEKN